MGNFLDKCPENQNCNTVLQCKLHKTISEINLIQQSEWNSDCTLSDQETDVTESPSDARSQSFVTCGEMTKISWYFHYRQLANVYYQISQVPGLFFLKKA